MTTQTTTLADTIAHAGQLAAEWRERDRRGEDPRRWLRAELRRMVAIFWASGITGDVAQWHALMAALAALDRIVPDASLQERYQQQHEVFQGWVHAGGSAPSGWEGLERERDKSAAMIESLGGPDEAARMWRSQNERFQAARTIYV